jgi:hypothetical protein
MSTSGCHILVFNFTICKYYELIEEPSATRNIIIQFLC